MSDVIEQGDPDSEAEELVPPIIIFHADCPDGFTAMTILNHCLGGGCELIEGRYGEEPPEVTGRHVWIVDFSYDRETMEKLWVVTESLSMLDHHATAADAIDWAVGDMNEAIEQARTGMDFVWIDQEQSGAGMVARFCAEMFNFDPPAWVWNVEDRDLWQFNLDYTAEIVAALTSYDYRYETWEALLEADYDELVTEGVAIERYREQLIGFAVSTAYRAVLPTGHECWVTCCPYTIGSDVAGRLAEMSEEGWAAYYVNYGGRVKYGLRANGKSEVRSIAEEMGGGGHEQAAGFECDLMPSPV